MRIKVLIALILALLGGCYVANGQQIIGRPLRPLSGCNAAIVNTAVFDGSNDFIAKSAANLTGLDSTNVFTIAFWCRYDGGNGTTMQILQEFVGDASNLRFQVYRNGNKYEMQGRNSVNSTLFTFQTTNTAGFSTTNGWHHVYACADLSDTNKRHFYVNGSEVPGTWSTYVNGTIEFRKSVATFPSWHIGANNTGSLKLNGALAELWFNDQYLDDVAKFYCGGHPVALGSQGEAPTGTAPALYLSQVGSGNSWANDSSGNGNNLTVTGSLGSTTSP